MLHAFSRYHLALFSLLSTQTCVVNAISSLHVNTSSGELLGFVDSTAPSVAKFLGIPYAEPPVGDLRWEPPKLKARGGIINATSVGPACLQFIGSTPTVTSTDVPWSLSHGPWSEDCLTVSIYTPYNHEDKKELLPIVVWIYGGSFSSGGTDQAAHNPSPWVQRSQRHIVVTFNYRLNIFGFPDAAGVPLSNQNLGFIDQRLALEWVRENIAQFQGDSSRIIFWGQSAGGTSIDNYDYAYPKDPIVSGLIIDSGAVYSPGASLTAGHTNFTYVADHLGCSNLSAAAELACMRNISGSTIEGFLQKSLSVSFFPVIDNRTKFANYTERALARSFSGVPAIQGTNANEGNSIVTFHPDGVNETEAIYATTEIHLCPLDASQTDRYNANVTTFRYFYSGNFSNVSPRLWEGAYHTAELPQIFGTAYLGGPSTQFEIAVSERMQDLWYTFAAEGADGLERKGWRKYRPDGTGAHFAYKGVVQQSVNVSLLTEPCNGSMAILGKKAPEQKNPLGAEY